LAARLFSLFDSIAVRDLASAQFMEQVAPGLEVNVMQDTVFSKKIDWER
jgi:hypothetical protein